MTRSRSIFRSYGPLGRPGRLDDYPHAFSASLIYLSVLAAEVALFIQLFPRDER